MTLRRLAKAWRALLAAAIDWNAAAGSAEAGDASLVNGDRRYNSACIPCHRPHGAGSTFAPSPVEKKIDADAFRRAAPNGKANGASGMQGFRNDPNIAPYVNDICAYPKARASGVLGRGRPAP